MLCICVRSRDKYRYIWHFYINLRKSHFLCIWVRLRDKTHMIWHFSKIAVLRWHRRSFCICVRSRDKYRYIWHIYIILSKSSILCICVRLRDKYRYIWHIYIFLRKNNIMLTFYVYGSDRLIKTMWSDMFRR